MGILRCLQRLRHSSHRSRLLQLLVAVGIAAAVFGITFYGFVPRRPNSQHLSTCCRKNQVVLFFHASESLALSRICLPINTMQTSDFSFLEIEAQGTKCKVAALRTGSVGDLMAELSIKGIEKSSFPLIAVIQDSFGAEYLIVCEEDGQISLSSMKHLIEHCAMDQKNENLIEVVIPSHRKRDKEPPSVYIAMH
jgi:hypothetical protein